jgi:ATP-binding cassette, subfamily B, bacterial
MRLEDLHATRGPWGSRRLTRRVERRGERRLIRRIAHEAAPFRWHLTGILLVSLLSTPLALLAPVPLKMAVDSVLGDEPLPGFIGRLLPGSISQDGLLLFAAVLLVVIALLNHGQFLLQYLLETYTGEQMTLRLRSRLLGHAQRLSFGFHDRRGTNYTIYRIQVDATSISHLAVYGVIPFIALGLTVASMIYVIFRLDAQLALVAVAISPLLFSYNRVYKRRMRSRYRDAHELQNTAMSVVQEVLTSFRVVKAFGREQDEEQRFTEASERGVRARVRLSVAEGLLAIVINLTTAVGTAFVLYLGVRSVQTGRITLGELLLIIGYLSQLYAPLKEMSQNLASLQGQLTSAERVFALLDEVPDVADRPDARPIRRARGAIRFAGVSFEYEPGRPVLEDVSFAIEPGTRVGVVGATGAGKTTLVSLATRFYDPTAGSVTLDGTDLRDLRLEDLRRQYAVVLQEPLLFSTSIGDNIGYARPEASHDEIVAAARAAGAHGFISALPDGYDTIVGERGMGLSGGERQRISLARAFLRDAPILVLDEPTSSVDTATERIIMEAMDRLMAGRTTFMIAHRLSTLRDCDVLLSVEDARVVLAIDPRHVAATLAARDA